MKAFAQRNNISFHGVKNYFYKKKPSMPETKNQHENPVQAKVSIEQAMFDAVRKKGDLPLEKEDIQAAAERAGVHYHTALSTWGNMVANAKAFITTEPCGDRNCLWFKGDAFAVLAKNGLPYEEIAKISNTDVAEVEKLISTCSKFPKETRTYSLHFDYYSLVKNKENPGKWLQKAVDEGWNIKELDAAIKGEPVPLMGKVKKENKKLVEENNALKGKLKNQNEILEELDKVEKRISASEAKFLEALEKTSIVSVDHIKDLYNTIHEQNEEIVQLKAQAETARRVNGFILEALVKKNAELLKAKYPVVAVHQEQQEQLHVN